MRAIERQTDEVVVMAEGELLLYMASFGLVEHYGKIAEWLTNKFSRLMSRKRARDVKRK